VCWPVFTYIYAGVPLWRNSVPEVLSQKDASRNGVQELFSWHWYNTTPLLPNFGSLFEFRNLFQRKTALDIVKLRLRQANRETSHVGKLPAPSYLARVDVYLPDIRTRLAFNFRQVDVYTWQVTLSRPPAHVTCLYLPDVNTAILWESFSADSEPTSPVSVGNNADSRHAPI